MQIGIFLHYNMKDGFSTPTEGSSSSDLHRNNLCAISAFAFFLALSQRKLSFQVVIAEFSKYAIWIGLDLIFIGALWMHMYLMGSPFLIIAYKRKRFLVIWGIYYSKKRLSL